MSRVCLSVCGVCSLKLDLTRTQSMYNDERTLVVSEFVKYKALKKGKKKDKMRLFVLFSDVLLICKKNPIPKKKRQYHLVHTVNLKVCVSDSALCALLTYVEYDGRCVEV